MSADAIKAGGHLGPVIRDRMPEVIEHRPWSLDWRAAFIVHLKLCTAHRTSSGVAAESVAQLVEATGLPEQQVKRALMALADMQLWHPGRRGTRGGDGKPPRPTERRPGFLLSVPPMEPRNSADDLWITGTSDHSEEPTPEGTSVPIQRTSVPIDRTSVPPGDPHLRSTSVEEPQPTKRDGRAASAAARQALKDARRRTPPIDGEVRA